MICCKKFKFGVIGRQFGYQHFSRYPNPCGLPTCPDFENRLGGGSLCSGQMERDSGESYNDILGFWQKSTYNFCVYLCSHMKFFIGKQGSEI